MIDYKAIKEKIERLESDASTIENEIRDFFRSVEISSIQYGLSIEKWTTLDGDLIEYHNSIIKHYEFWYTQSHMLIQTLYQDKELEFKELHSGKMVDYTGPNSIFYPKSIVTKKIHEFYGISELLQINDNVKRLYNPQSLAQVILGLFSKQQGILLALLDILPLLPIKRENQEIKSSDHHMKEPSLLSQTFNIQAIGTQTNETIINIKSFSQVNDFIENTITDENNKNELIQKVKEFEKISNTKDYFQQYQKFVDILADHISVFGPVLKFLLEHAPK
jgi:hypothetical protein